MSGTHAATAPSLNLQVTLIPAFDEKSKQQVRVNCGFTEVSVPSAAASVLDLAKGVKKFLSYPRRNDLSSLA
jgi:hypothetical protein